MPLQMLYQDYNNQPDPNAKKDEEKAELRNNSVKRIAYQRDYLIPLGYLFLF